MVLASRCPKPRAARGGRDARWPALGAGGRRHRQDQGAHHPHRPILSQGRAWPSQILAVTFTNKAAREMTKRVGELIGGRSRAPGSAPSTPSARESCAACRADRSEAVFTILDTDDQLRLLKQLLEAAGSTTKRWPPRLLPAVVERWKNRGLRPIASQPRRRASPRTANARDLYVPTRSGCATSTPATSATCCCTSHPVPEHPDVLARLPARSFASSWSTSTRTPTSRSTCGCGSWRKATTTSAASATTISRSIPGAARRSSNILRFERDFPGAKVIRLECNYRSTSHILGAASGLIAHNTGASARRCGPTADDGDKVGVHGTWDERGRGAGVGEDIEAAAAQGRVARQMRDPGARRLPDARFEERLITVGLPYRVVGGPLLRAAGNPRRHRLLRIVS